MLPASAMILELSQPAQGEGEEEEDGATAVVAFDFAAPEIA